MHRLVCFNGQIADAESVAIRAVSSASLYGKGVFTTIRIVKGSPLWWEKHWFRLRRHAQHIGFETHKLPNEILLFNCAKRLIEENSCAEGKMRITLFDESSNGIWHTKTAGNTPSFLLTTAPLEKQRDVYRLTVADFPIHSRAFLSGIKSCNYTANIAALNDARKNGFDECLILNEKEHIVSASTANIFIERDGKIFTPPISDGCLEGTTREFIIETCQKHSIPVEEKSIDREMLNDSLIFLTSNGIGIRRGVCIKESNIAKKNFEFFQVISELYQSALVKF